MAARAEGTPEQRRRAEDGVVVDHLWLANVIASRYRGRGADFDDLQQVAGVGLVKAARRWRPELGGFLAYAMPTVEGEVKRFFRDSGTAIRIPRALYESLPRVAAAELSLRQEASREPTPAEVADRAGMPADRVRQVRSALRMCRPLSTDAAIDAFDEPASADAERDLSIVAIRTGLKRAIDTLAPRERHIIALRFVWGQSQLQIANAIGISQMQVSRVLRVALGKIRAHIEEPEGAR